MKKPTNIKRSFRKNSKQIRENGVVFIGNTPQGIATEEVPEIVVSDVLVEEEETKITRRRRRNNDTETEN